MIGRSIKLTVVGALVALAFFAHRATSQDAQLQIVVERSEGYVELYLSTPAASLVELFDLPPQKLVGSDGNVNFDHLRLGTAHIGDRLFERVRSQAGGTDIKFEAMSLMLHPISEKLPLNNALDGAIAIGVCNTPTPEHRGLSRLQAYTGLIVDTEKFAETISLKLPNSSEKTWTVIVRDHVDGKLSREYVATISGDGKLTLPGPTGTSNNTS